MTKNRNYKSSVFTDLFGDDELEGKRNFLSLYNALHGTNLKYEETKMERKQIPQSLYKSFYTDISMLIDDRLIIFVEHQSTLNENMPLRFLEYYTHILTGMIPSKSRYRKKLYKIPTPEFFVFYTGPYPKRKSLPTELKLSDSFISSQQYPLCELKVHIENVGGEQGKKLPVVQNCAILKQYCELLDAVIKYESKLAEGATTIEAMQAFQNAINECIEKGILPDYLRRKSSEVVNMFLDEYDYDTDIEVQREEAHEEGVEEKAEEDAIALLNENLSPELIARCIKLPLEKVLELQKQIKETAQA